MTQLETIKILLEDGNWVCGTEFMKEFIPEYRSRINELRKKGLVIDARPCKQHEHNSKILQEWRLLGKQPESHQRPLNAPKSNERPQTPHIPNPPLFTHFSPLNH